MVNAFHIHVSKGSKIAFCVFIGLFGISATVMAFQQKWDRAFFDILYSFLFIGLLYNQMRPFVRVTSKNKLYVGLFSIDISSIYLLKEQPNRKIKIHYFIDGKERYYPLPVAHYEIASFMDTMKQLNPAIQIN